MGQATLVEMQIQNGGRLIDRLTQEGVAVTAAGWVKESESGEWYLYLATPLVSEQAGKTPAYRRVNAVIRAMKSEGFQFDLFEVKVIGPHDPIARDLQYWSSSVKRDTQRWNRPQTPFKFAGYRLGELAIEEAFIYHPPPANPEKAAGVGSP